MLRKEFEGSLLCNAHWPGGLTLILWNLWRMQDKGHMMRKPRWGMRCCLGKTGLSGIWEWNHGESEDTMGTQETGPPAQQRAPKANLICFTGLSRAGPSELKNEGARDGRMEKKYLLMYHLFIHWAHEMFKELWETAGGATEKKVIQFLPSSSLWSQGTPRLCRTSVLLLRYRTVRDVFSRLATSSL